MENIQVSCLRKVSDPIAEWLDKMNLTKRLISKLNPDLNPKAIQQPQHRQARLLTWILRFTILFSAVILVVVLIFNPHHDPEHYQYVLLISGLVVLFVFAYLLNRSGNYNLSAMLLVASAVIPPWASLLFDPSILQGDFVPLVYVTFSILLSSIFFPTYITFVLAVLQFTGITLILLLSPANASFNWFSFLAFVFLASVFSILANTIIQRDMKQIADQARLLSLNEALLREQAIRDHLTNLFNRRYLEETLQREIQRAVRKQTSLGIIMLDVDDFKHINDTLGHSAGDTVLKELGKLLGNYIRQSDIACRYGGDEFLLVLPDASQEVTLERAEILRSEVKQIKSPVSFTLSLGVAFFPVNGIDSETLLKAADSALYRAKHNGNNRVVWQNSVK